MNKLFYFSVIFLTATMFQLQAQDTLFLKSGVKYPCNVRKMFFLSESKIVVRLLVNGTVSGITFNPKDIKYFLTKDTTRLRRLARTQKERLAFFRYLDTNGTHIAPIEIINRVESQAKLNLTRQKGEILYRNNYFGMTFGPSMQVNNQVIELGLNKEVTLRYTSNYSASVEYSYIGKYNFGLGTRFQYNFGSLKATSNSTAPNENTTTFQSFAFSAGPKYRLQYQRIFLDFGFNYGIVSFQMEGFDVPFTPIQSDVYKINYQLKSNATQFYYNSSFSISYKADYGVELFCLFNFMAYQIEVETVGMVSDRFNRSLLEPIKLPAKSIAYQFLDYRLGINLLF